ncbi:hypothetical protein LCGC14_0544010 [marine sediment metagenome]|uniref:Yip1 domain-containing protein n=1 Tax=marine sediment metagenome TaxID=412755 RepID=A0A0F9UDA5_9ZZZZ|nr:MAG: hypothetical protein Lokiarch_03320 [Candidatus Lokiarchaeum sp. GC14_75]HEA70925.1 hypothetical protein [archaeon]
MLFQIDNTVLFVIGLILATIILTLIIYIAVLLIVSKTKASDKIILIVLLAFICVLVIPLVLGAIGSVFGVFGQIPWSDGNYLTLLIPVIGFLIIMILVKFLLDVAWDNAVWIALLTLFILFLLYTLVPSLATFLGFTI